MMDASNKETLKKLGIRYILNVTKECPIFHPNDFIYMRIDLYDQESSNLYPYYFNIHDIKYGSLP